MYFKQLSFLSVLFNFSFLLVQAYTVAACLFLICDLPISKKLYFYILSAQGDGNLN
jgi:hypothetical protein